MILITIHLPLKENSHLEDVSVCNSFPSHFMGQFYFLPAFHCSPGEAGEGETDTQRHRENNRETETDFPKLLTRDLEN